MIISPEKPEALLKEAVEIARAKFKEQYKGPHADALPFQTDLYHAAEAAIGERIDRLMAAIMAGPELDNLAQNIARRVISQALTFDEGTTQAEMKDPSRYCLKCGEAWATHNDDGSCVADEEEGATAPTFRLKLEVDLDLTDEVRYPEAIVHNVADAIDHFVRGFGIVGDDDDAATCAITVRAVDMDDIKPAVRQLL